MEKISPNASHSLLADYLGTGVMDALQTVEIRFAMAGGRIYAILGCQVGSVGSFRYGGNRTASLAYQFRNTPETSQRDSQGGGDRRKWQFSGHHPNRSLTPASCHGGQNGQHMQPVANTTRRCSLISEKVVGIAN
jgi:hypothetical protein